MKKSRCNKCKRETTTEVDFSHEKETDSKFVGTSSLPGNSGYRNVYRDVAVTRVYSTHRCSECGFVKVPKSYSHIL